jgi:hypothetical protein
MGRTFAGIVLGAVLALLGAPRVHAEDGQGAATFTPQEIARLKELASSDKRFVRSRVDVDLYGFLKVDLAYDAHATDEGDFARWVASEGATTDDDELSVTVRETRVGLDLALPKACGARASGKLEIDFYGGGTPNSNTPRLRHAYLRLEWPACGLALLAGQTWDTHLPQNMPTINYSVGWWVGNLGFRRPQLRLTKAFPLGAAREVQVEVAAARTITGRDTPFTPPFADTGEDEGTPTAQGRLSLAGTSRWGARSVLGLSGHWGREELDRAAGGTSHFVTWSFGVDAALAVAPCWTLKGEAWRGRNVDAYLGGIGQGLNRAVVGAERGIDAWGAWLAVVHEAGARWTLAAGGALDDPQDGDLAPGMRARNLTLFANAWFKLMDRAKVGAELSWWETRYRGMPRGDSLRVQGGFVFEF